MLGIFGLGPSEMVCLGFIAVVVALAVVLTRRPSRTAPPRADEPLRRIKRDYETLTARERRELLDFIQSDLGGPEPPASEKVRPPAPPEGYTP